MSSRKEHRLIDDIKCKRCCNCQEWKALEKYPKRKSSWDGFNHECKDCVNIRNREQNAGTWIPKPSRQRTRFLIECRCGCGAIIETPDNLCRERLFVKGHHFRIQNKGKYRPHMRETNEQKKIRHSFIGGIEDKVCSKCREWKSLGEFYNNKSSWDGKSYRCKSCQQKRALGYYHANSDEIAEKRKTPEYRERFNAYCREYDKQRKRTDVNYRLKKALRSRLRDVIKGRKKHKKTLELLGCSVDDARLYLQEQFLPGMTWNNYGKWEIDHIIPCAAFDLSKQEHQERCFHYTNLQPLWAEDNARKSNYVPERMKP